MPEDTAQGMMSKEYLQPAYENVGISVVLNDSLSVHQRLKDAFSGRAGGDASVQTLSEEFDLPFLVSNSHVLTFTRSDYMAGRFDSTGEYTPEPKFDITVRERRQDGELKSPPIKLTLKVEPHSSELRYEDGNCFSSPIKRDGTRLTVRTGAVDNWQEGFNRALRLIEEAIDASVSPPIHKDTKRITPPECFYRLSIDVLPELHECLKDTAALLPPAADSEFKRMGKEGSIILDAKQFDEIGFGDCDGHYRLKVYFPRTDAGVDATGGVKFEVHYKTEESRYHHPSDWPAIIKPLEQLLVSHCVFAGVSNEDVMAGGHYQSRDRPTRTYQIPKDRRSRVLDEYDTLLIRVLTDVLNPRSSTKAQTLYAISAAQYLMYDDLGDRIDKSRSAIQYHVEHLEQLGYCEREGNPAVIKMRSRLLARRVTEILRKVREADYWRGSDGGDESWERLEPEELAEREFLEEVVSFTNWDTEQIIKALEDGRLSPEDLFTLKD